ncbi:MAG: GNAT family N-acetyltransferase [Gemmatimonadetes bacterium]|jgi:GNAT superfamily N-acetyltransferase|nr:GNAT family N-acetyltransferase [Gemmatimonadota bacterium]MBP7549642.1 GNAT family N-acetyltransferase [Gemmatimonadaceae bacterium]
MTDVAQRITGPFPIRGDDLGGLNVLFSDAFSERYRRDGMAGVRVPPLNPAIWRFAIEGAGDGAMLWRDGLGRIAAFNIAHASGTEGWMGPLAVREDLQGRGLGRTIVRAGIERLRAAGCTVIGLETMPRTMDNIGFYAGLGFTPGRLTLTLTVEATPLTDQRPPLLGAHALGERAAVIAECLTLTRAVRPGVDFTREIELTLRYGIGDVVLLRNDAGLLEGFALFHDVPLVEGRMKEEIRVLKCVLAEESMMARMAEALAAQARRSGALRCAIRAQGEYTTAFRSLIARGARVRWTDLRMSLGGFEERPPVHGLVLSNWEI